VGCYQGRGQALGVAANDPAPFAEGRIELLRPLANFITAVGVAEVWEDWMIVQACLNGARRKEEHPRLPLTVDAIASDAADCVAAGAGELHIHARGSDGAESLSSVDETVWAVRRTCPGTLLGVSTGTWIERDEKRTRDCIAAWRELPDYASVNLSERDAPAIIALLHSKGVGVEAGLATVADTERFVALAECRRALRILIEIAEPDLARGYAVADDIADVLNHAEVRRPILLHGSDATVWHFVRRARKMRWSTRVGLEDGSQLPNGETAARNAALVSEAVRLWARN
jgi:uncharacterized protein (DUF849 family)